MTFYHFYAALILSGVNPKIYGKKNKVVWETVILMMMKMMDELAFFDVLEDVMMKMMMMMMMTMMDELAVVDVLEGVAFVLCCIGSLYQTAHHILRVSFSL